MKAHHNPVSGKKVTGKSLGGWASLAALDRVTRVKKNLISWLSVFFATRGNGMLVAWDSCCYDIAVLTPLSLNHKRHGNERTKRSTCTVRWNDSRVRSSNKQTDKRENEQVKKASSSRRIIACWREFWLFHARRRTYVRTHCCWTHAMLQRTTNFHRRHHRIHNITKPIFSVAPIYTTVCSFDARKSADEKIRLAS